MTVMALDVGDRRTGIAVSDPDEQLARPLRTIERAGSSEGIASICQMVDELNVSTVVVGLPLRLDGTRGPQADRAASLADRLQARLDVPVVLHDERFTSTLADRLHGDGGHDRDSRAAAHLLSSWMEART